MSGETDRDRPDWWLHEVPETEDGTRIDRYLRRLVTGLTQGPVEKMPVSYTHLTLPTKA